PAQAVHKACRMSSPCRGGAPRFHRRHVGNKVCPGLRGRVMPEEEKPVKTRVVPKSAGENPVAFCLGTSRAGMNEDVRVQPFTSASEFPTRKSMGWKQRKPFPLLPTPDWSRCWRARCATK